jgi:hypothetical protein
MFQNLCALTELGHEVHLAIIGKKQPVDEEVAARVAGVHWVEPGETPALLRPFQRALNPETFALRFPKSHTYPDLLVQLASRIEPELIWADSSFSLGFAPRDRYPVVFGNYDFLFKLKKVREQTRARLQHADLRDPKALRRRILRRPDAMSVAALERYELQLTREAAHVMCVSASEADFCRANGIAATHIPIVGPTIDVPRLEVPDRPPRFFLFGNHNTAHAAALADIRHNLWPALERANVRCEWHQIGKAPAHPDDDWRWMERTFQHIHGFVEDLGTLFGVGDVSVVPYRHDTGFRTKFTVAAGYGVVSAGYDETFLCAPEFKPGVDAIAASSAEGLASQFGRVITDRELRRALGVGARSLYDAAFTFEAQLPRYAEVVSLATSGRPHRQAHA